jgi:hypothetical protein
MVDTPKKLVIIIEDPKNSDTPQYLEVVFEELQKLLQTKQLKLISLQESSDDGQPRKV